MMSNKSRTEYPPPKLAHILLLLSVSWEYKDEVERDLYDLFQIRVKNWGIKHARRKYWRDVYSIWLRRSWIQELNFTNLNTFSMLKNYLKVTLRNLRKQKSYAFINVFGLSIGLAFCALIFLFVQHELSYDTFHENKDRIFRVEQTRFSKDGSAARSNSSSSIPLGPSLKEEIPGIIDYSRTYNTSHYVRTDNEPIRERILYTDESLFTIFTFPVVSGSTEQAFEDRNSVVISEQIAIKYFGTENPVGKTIEIKRETPYSPLGNSVFEPFTIRAVIENIPSNSSIRFNVALPIQKSPLYREEWLTNWKMNLFGTYALFDKQPDMESINASLDSFHDKYHGDYSNTVREREGWEASDRPLSYRMRSLTDIHLTIASDPIYSYILTGIAFAILFIACINFMILSIGRSSKRSKEVGLRKVVGAFRHQLMFQFWGEAFLISFLALIVGIVLAESFLPTFNLLARKSLSFDYLENGSIILAFVSLILFTGFIAGSYPALLLSKANPVVTLKNTLKLSGTNFFTKSLVVLQFSLSVFLITCTVIMNNQLSYTQNKDLGFNKDHTILLPLKGLNGSKLAKQFKTLTASDPNIIDIMAMGNTLGKTGSLGYGVTHNGEGYNISVFSVESNYLDFLEIDLLYGRGFNPELTTDTSQAVLVNKALVDQLDIEEPIGKKIPYLGEGSHENAVIVGVIENLHFQSLYNEFEPALFSLDNSWGYANLLVKINPNATSESIAALSSTWGQLVPDIPFTYSFLDEELKTVYRNDQRWTRIINYASMFAIIIACLGLFGLVTLTVVSRKKEVGIRKVLGASVSRIMLLFTKDFAILVIIGITISVPIAYYVMTQWLTSFAFKISIGAEHFLLASLLVLVIALVTISYQTIKAGLANPTETLSSE